MPLSSLYWLCGARLLRPEDVVVDLGGRAFGRGRVGRQRQSRSEEEEG